MLKSVILFVSIIMFVFTMAFVGNSFDWWTLNFFGSKFEQVRYDIHKHSQAYQDGMAQQLADAAEQWSTLNETQRGSIRAVLRSRFRDFDTTNLPPDLVSFYIDSIKGNN